MDHFLEIYFIKEIETQCKHGLFSYTNINQLVEADEYNNDAIWFYIESFLISAANISKFLWGADKPKDNKKRYKERIPLRQKLDVSDDWNINKRGLRNVFEHYDEKLEQWYEKARYKQIVDKNIGPKRFYQITNTDKFLRHYDQTIFELSFQNQTFNLFKVAQEMEMLLENIEKNK